MSQSAECSLAAYAVSDDASLGRRHDEPPDPLRSAFELDRHRIVSSTAFRRLQYKTQVFVNDEHDHFRTRLTHSLEVAETARRLAIALRVNERLAEAIALAHDLGHPPFGHAGEKTLSHLMADTRGFEHNTHSLRIVDYLEHPYPAFRGLNLSYEVREALIKHTTKYDQPKSSASPAPKSDEALSRKASDLLASGPFPSIEGQIASAADAIAYDCHDLEDALGAGLIAGEDLSDLKLWNRAARTIRNNYPEASVFAVRRPILDRLLDDLLNDLIHDTSARLMKTKVDGVAAVRRCPDAIVGFSSETRGLMEELESFLAERVYGHQKLVEMDRTAGCCIEGLFGAYIADLSTLPPRFTARIEEQGVQCVVCDYIAGMTDRFCRDEFDRLVGPSRNG